ncbi:MAG: hypothetical protein RIB61_00240 [Roseicyclus sp.]
MTGRQTTVLIIGSGPNAISAAAWDRRHFTHVVAINNAWQVRPDWDFTIFPEDFPHDRRPAFTARQQAVTAAQYVPLQNRYGGFVYAGGTMAFTAGYWALAALRPSTMAFIGCDMVYSDQGNTHFYGTGQADPLRDDVTLQSLEAKSARLAILAARAGCQCVNLSSDPSRLVFARSQVVDLASVAGLIPDAPSLAKAENREAELGYMVPSGRYWEVEDQFDTQALRSLDALWLAAFAASTA